MRSTLRPLLSLMVTVLLTLLPRVVQAQAPQVFTGTGPDGVATAIAAFKAAIGGADNGAFPGSLPTGYRQVTWDDVPDQYAEPNNLPPDFYNTVSPRGLMLNPIGYVGAFQVSATVPNPTSTPVLFGHADLFTTFSAPRIFSGGSESGPGAAVRFNVPGATTAAMVSGFGVVFTDVQIASTARLILYDADYQPLGTFNAPVTPDHRNVSFIGVVFPTARIHHVYLFQGTYRGSSSMPEDASHDLVALDDVVYGEPQPVPCLLYTSPSPRD